MRGLSLSLLILFLIAAGSQASTTTLKDYRASVRNTVFKSDNFNSNNRETDDAPPACHCACKCCLQQSINCDSYCVCVDGRSSKLNKCLGGLKFNPYIENCDAPENFECEGRPPPPENFTCLKEKGLYEYPGNCSLFIHCSHWVPEVKFCPSILHFSEVSQRCEQPEDAHCPWKDNSTPPPTPIPSPSMPASTITPNPPTTTQRPITSPPPHPTPPPGFKCLIEDGLYAFPQNCSLFIHCSHGAPEAKFCPNNLHFSEASQRCEEQENANCTWKDETSRTVQEKTPLPSRMVKRAATEFPCPIKHGFFPLLGKPSSFYKCVDGFATGESKCSAGLVFNPALSACSKM